MDDEQNEIGNIGNIDKYNANGWLKEQQKIVDERNEKNSLKNEFLGYKCCLNPKKPTTDNGIKKQACGNCGYFRDYEKEWNKK